MLCTYLGGTDTKADLKQHWIIEFGGKKTNASYLELELPVQSIPERQQVMNWHSFRQSRWNGPFMYCVRPWSVGPLYARSTNVFRKENEATWRWCEPTCLCLELLFDLDHCDLWPLEPIWGCCDKERQTQLQGFFFAAGRWCKNNSSRQICYAKFQLTVA